MPKAIGPYNIRMHTNGVSLRCTPSVMRALFKPLPRLFAVAGNAANPGRIDAVPIREVINRQRGLLIQCDQGGRTGRAVAPPVFGITVKYVLVDPGYCFVITHLKLDPGPERVCQEDAVIGQAVKHGIAAGECL